MTDLTIDPILKFLLCETPKQWLEMAVNDQDTLLIDHAHCEKKAALTALHLIHRYPQYSALVFHASRLAREELRHFEKVIALLKKRNIKFVALTPSRYANGLRQYVAKDEPKRLIDLLIIGALIEARSCERFYQLLPFVEQEISQFYRTLFLSEARHFQLYLDLARQYWQQHSVDVNNISDIEQRITFFSDKEASLIQSNDSLFRFHSGVPSIVS